MAFVTDKQTWDDLNITGRPGSASVYDLYNRCCTRGGAALLEEIFHYPLSSAAAINDRCSIISFFAQHNKPFPFTVSYFDAIENYLANTDDRTKLTHNDSMRSRLGKLVAADIETQTIYKGIDAVVALLLEVKNFLAENIPVADHPYHDEYNAIAAILAEPVLLPVTGVGGKMPRDRYVEFDALLRFKVKELLKTLLQHLFLLDVFLSVAAVAVEKNYCFPTALPAAPRELVLEGVYHPLLRQAVPNTLRIAGDDNVLFLTGANMAGKSTLMKTLGISLVLAHMGMPVPAAAMRFSVMDGIYTTINLPDNLGMGASHFYAEVLRVKKIAKELSAGRNIFVVFDELFRGTNVKDAHEATVAVVKGFARQQKGIFVISTHIMEAAEVLRQDCSNILYVYLPTRMKNNIPEYTYTLEEGVTDDRHGMIIIQNEKILDILEEGLKNMPVYEQEL